MKHEIINGWSVHMIILFLFFALIPFSSNPQDSGKQTHFVFNGYVKDMQTFIFQDLNSDLISANLVHNRLNLKWFVSSSFTAAIELRNRLLVGNLLTGYPGYNQTFEVDQGITDLSWNLIDQKSLLFNTSADRLWLQYSRDKFQITAGRQRINWGQTFVWNPNDIFNSYSYFDFDYEEKPGSDAIRFQYYTTPSSVVEFAIKSNNLNQATLAALYRFNRWNYDFQFIGGVVDQNDLVIGTGWSGQIAKGGFRGEASYFIQEKKLSDSSSVFLADIGYDYTFKNSLFLQFEFLYNSNRQSTGNFEMNLLNSQVMSAKNLFLSECSLFGSLSYPFTPLITGSFAGIGNPKNKMFFVIPSISISLLENLELTFTAQIMRYTGSEVTGQNLNMIYARLKRSF